MCTPDLLTQWLIWGLAAAIDLRIMPPIHAYQTSNQLLATLSPSPKSKPNSSTTLDFSLAFYLPYEVHWVISSSLGSPGT